MLECRADIPGFLLSLLVEVSLARAISIVVGSLPGDKAICRHVAKQDDEPAFLERLDKRLTLQQRS